MPNFSGKTVYYLGELYEALKISKRILTIYEKMYGFESLKTANALGNVGSVSRRLNDTENCHRAMYRALNIFRNIYDASVGEEQRDKAAKTVMRHRAQMYQFDMTDWEVSLGITYEEYLNFDQEEFHQRQLERQAEKQREYNRHMQRNNEDDDYGDDVYEEL